MIKKIAIIGAGGQARETYHVLTKYLFFSNPEYEFVGFFESTSTKDRFLNYSVKNLTEYDPSYTYHIAIGNGKVRESIVNSLPKSTRWLTIIDPDSIIGQDVEIGEGSFIPQGTIITENVRIGKQVHLNIGCSISHDVTIGDFFTMAPGSRIMGGCKVGKLAYMGAQSCIKDKISICEEATIGMGAMVVKNITEPGIYIGIPANKMK